MMPAMKRILCLLLSGWIVSIPASARMVELTILHTTDLHGHIWPTTTYEGQADVGGVLRCAARIEQLRAQIPNTLLIDCGDTFQGAPESYLTDGRLLIDALNELAYDAWVLGNHEIDWGTKLLRARHDQVAVPFLAANLGFPSPEANWLPKVQPFVIREVDGIRVAIIGLTTPGIPRWSRPHLLDGALFRRSVETLGAVMPLVKAERPDVIVAAVHQGFRNRGDDFANEVRAIAAAFPEIDVMLGGHTHTPVEDMRFGPVLFSQAGYYGIWLGRVSLTYDTVEKAVVEKKGALELMDASVPYHEGLRARWSNELAAAAAELDQPWTEWSERLDPAPDAIGRSSMQQVIAAAIAGASGADFVLHGSLDDKPLEPGALQRRDAWRIVPYENTIGVVSLTPQEIREILADNHARPLGAMSLGPYGFTYEVTAGADGRPVIGELRDLDGKPLHARKRYRVAMNSYVLASGGERNLAARRLADQPESRLEMLPFDTRGAVMDFMREQAAKRAAAKEPVAVP